MFDLIIYRGAIPAAVALALAVSLRYVLPKGPGRRDALPLGFLAAFWLGYVLLPDWAPLEPKKHWHWIPYIALVAASVGPVYLASGVHLLERLSVQLVITVLAAFLLTPKWATLDPPRQIMIPLLATYLFVLCASIEPLAARIAPSFTLLVLAVTALSAMVLVSSEISLQIGEVLMVAASASVGLLLASVFVPTVEARSIVLLYCTVVAGLVFAVHLEPEPERRGLLLLPLAPLAVWLGELKKMRQGSAAVRIAVQLLGVLAVLIASALWTLSERPAEKFGDLRNSSGFAGASVARGVH